jgi:hypothetical protein
MNTNTEKKQPISMLTASLDTIKYVAARQPFALKSAVSFEKQEKEKEELLKNTKTINKIYY